MPGQHTKKTLLRFTLIFSCILMAVKFTAYYLTGSNAILTDALESIINVIAGSFALYSMHYASKPQDRDHPYGHGKMEYLSAGFEGALILFAGLAIITKAGYAFFIPHEITSADTGTVLSAISGLCNFLMGYYLIQQGKKHNSALMVADGKHLVSDTVSSIGLVLGLIVIWLTGMFWLDNLMAVIFGAMILYTGFKLIRESVTSLLDEADQGKLEQVVEIISKNRKDKWIDIHNLRALKYGSSLHVDCHITLPWYDSLEDSHAEVEEVEKLVANELQGEVEFFIHADPCIPSSCPLCTMEKCRERKTPFVKRLDWTLENVLPDRKHRLE